tara:strand:- start:2174 stop:2419 length:246 start_codon:yes stop_codon:yes gene_type:complete
METRERYEHGLTGYTKGCRCDFCKGTKAAYERMRRQMQQEKKSKEFKKDKKNKQQSLDHDTMTISEYKKHREVEEAKRQFN